MRFEHTLHAVPGPALAKPGARATVWEWPGILGRLVQAAEAERAAALRPQAAVVEPAPLRATAAHVAEAA
jgi:hypothetical protein